MLYLTDNMTTYVNFENEKCSQNAMSEQKKRVGIFPELKNAIK